MSKHDFTPEQQAGVDAVNCIMPPLIAGQLAPSERLDAMAAKHMTTHWAELTDEGKFSAFAYVCATMAHTAAQQADAILTEAIFRTDGAPDRPAAPGMSVLRGAQRRVQD